MDKTILITVFMVLSLALAADAARVAVIVDTGSAVSSRCHDAGDGSRMDFLCDTSYYECDDFGWGAFVTHINGHECSWSPENQQWWALYRNGQSSWLGISEIPAEDGLLIGWRCGGGEAPDSDLAFCDICGCESGGRGKRIPRILDIKVSPDNPTTEDKIRVNLSDRESGTPLGNARGDVYSSGSFPGVNKPLRTLYSDKDGLLEFRVAQPGLYKIRFSETTYYPHEEILVNVSQTTTTTTSTSTSTSTSTTTITSTSTTILLPEHILHTIEPTTTSTTPEKEPLIVGKAVAASSESPTGFFEWLWSLLF
jgi:hypothetical protein